MRAGCLLDWGDRGCPEMSAFGGLHSDSGSGVSRNAILGLYAAFSPLWLVSITLSAHSSPRREPLLDLVHQRVGEPSLAQFGKVLKHDGLPGLIAHHILLAAVLKIECPRLVHACEEHQCMSAVRVEPYVVRRDRDDEVGGFERLREIVSNYEPVCQLTERVVKLQ